MNFNILPFLKNKKKKKSCMSYSKSSSIGDSTSSICARCEKYILINILSRIVFGLLKYGLNLILEHASHTLTQIFI